MEIFNRLKINKLDPNNHYKDLIYNIKLINTIPLAGCSTSCHFTSFKIVLPETKNAQMTILPANLAHKAAIL
ncbi:hypothetical protein NIASO_00955 [Niabella soli DSM 19437]|uniref:Uncharacterized protein n=1 Tax=Niabella soli DSM 19437 TaxID=929713 RepID=W0F5F3_9BACT|nr:hypothetical protein NIASO_00955 [Niabella soli DSM 19437]